MNQKFDYVICTGVIHHNADPGSALEGLMAGLKPDGVLELMVYNRFHRQETTALQKALRLLADDRGRRDDELQFAIAEQLMDGLTDESSVLDFLRGLQDAHRSRFADSVI